MMKYLYLSIIRDLRKKSSRPLRIRSYEQENPNRRYYAERTVKIRGVNDKRSWLLVSCGMLRNP